MFKNVLSHANDLFLSVVKNIIKESNENEDNEVNSFYCAIFIQNLNGLIKCKIERILFINNFTNGRVSHHVFKLLLYVYRKIKSTKRQRSEAYISKSYRSQGKKDMVFSCRGLGEAWRFLARYVD